MGIVTTAIFFFFAIVFTVLYVVFKKINPNQSPTATIKFWLSVLVLTPIVAIASLYAYLFFSSRYEDKAFEKSSWIQDEDERYLYINDLVNNEMLINKSKEEILNKLGDPNFYEADTLHYSIGYDPKQYFNMRPDWLVLEFTNNTLDTFYIRK